MVMSLSVHSDSDHRFRTPLAGHGYSLSSVDELTSAPGNGNAGNAGNAGDAGDSVDPSDVNPADVQSFTFCAHPGRPVDGLDQLW